ncbi:hypothetical protein SAMN04515667_0830 [Formosa sp. Hel1_31_208]|uniref:hypothetical protein n=1 Tax=Formosa sp. Hel1_31_208 TaxID=1798225 RepID=UPI00087D5556|nr:hypothetical protein [Formosa sp. Hel1_31_208]SDR85071.1 hypothetical protein SAMN04515667_0830 [Formosa sp. Hel1_31_208]
MKDQNNPPESNLPVKKPNLFRDWWEEMYPHDFIQTFKNYFFNHKQFFDEVFNEQWDNKVKPMAFLFTAIGVSLIIGSISPWGLDFSDEPAPPVAWREMQKSMSQEERAAFVNAFQLQDFFNLEYDSPQYSQAVDNRLMEYLKSDTLVTATKLKEYFESKNMKELALRAHYVVLKQQVEHDKFLKKSEIGEIEQVVYLNLFVLWCMFYWLIAHRLFKRAKRTSRETVFVFMYGLGMLIFVVYVPLIAILGALDDNVLAIGFLLVLLLLIFVLYRIITIFKHTHNTGFFNLMLVYVKTFLVAGLLGVLLFAGAYFLMESLL